MRTRQRVVRMTINVVRTEIERTETAYGVRETRRAVPDGTLSGDVTIEVDFDTLLQVLGPRALRSKGKKATAISGLVIARASNLVRSPGA